MRSNLTWTLLILLLLGSLTSVAWANSPAPPTPAPIPACVLPLGD